MPQEEKQLLLAVLCARLPYGVKFHYTKHPQSNIDQDCNGTAIGYYCNLIVSANDKDFCVDRCKLYLRPMSSMTEEERQEYGLVLCDELSINQYDWLNKNHFDYRGLIEKGLALEAPEGMYNIKENKLCHNTTIIQ